MRNCFLGLAVCLTAALVNQGPLSAEPVPGALDGMVFVSTIEVEEYDRPFDDRMTFTDGTMFSEECQRACDFGAWDYQARVEGDAIAFVADMSCSDAPQSVRWEGRVTGDRIEGTAHWKVKRLYWTVERHATFEGVLVKGSDGQAAILTE